MKEYLIFLPGHFENAHSVVTNDIEQVVQSILETTGVKVSYEVTLSKKFIDVFNLVINHFYLNNDGALALSNTRVITSFKKRDHTKLIKKHFISLCDEEEIGVELDIESAVKDFPSVKDLFDEYDLMSNRTEEEQLVCMSENLSTADLTRLVSVITRGYQTLDSTWQKTKI